MTSRDDLVRRLAAVSHETWMRQKHRDQGVSLDEIPSAVTDHDLERAEDAALHMAARVQTMHPGPGRTHYQRKRAEHKTSAEALRSLKRQLAKVVYRHLRNDQVCQPSPLPALT